MRPRSARGATRARARRHTSSSARLTPCTPRRCQAVIWVLLGVGMFLRLKFDWLLLVGTALALSGANIIGYVRCKSGAHACPRAHLPRRRACCATAAALPPPRCHDIHMPPFRACRRCEGEDHQCGDQPTRRQLRHPGHAERSGQGLRLLARDAACGEVAGPLWAQGGRRVRGARSDARKQLCVVCVGGRVARYDYSAAAPEPPPS